VNPATVRPAIRTLVSDLTGISENFIFWSGRPRGYTSSQWILLRLSAIKSHGQDEVRYDYDITRDHGTPSAFDELEPTQVGLRDATLQIQCWSYVDTDAFDALSLALAIQDQIFLDVHRAHLATVDVAVASVGSPIEVPTIENDREVSVVTLDVFLNALASATGTRIGYVEHWGIEGEATMADGTTETIVNGVLP